MIVSTANSDVDRRPQVSGVTIDASHSRDLDDGIDCETTAAGWLLHVSITDVAHVVPPGSPLDLEARRRAFTRYHSAGSDPMIARNLAEHSASLIEGEPRLAVTLSIPVHRDPFELGPVQPRLTTFTSRKRLSHADVSGILRAKRHGLQPMLSEAWKIAQMLLEGRRRRGALAIYDLKRGWRTNEEGRLVRLNTGQDNPGYVIVQEFMIAANQALARWLLEHNIAALFRNHTARVAADDRETLFAEMLSALKSPEVDLATLSERVGLMINAADYGPTLKGHYGLNLPAYVHGTSPIRRYADLVIQRAVKSALANEGPAYTVEELQQIAAEVNRVALQVRDERREIEKQKYYRALSHSASETDALTRLSDSEIYHAIKLACREGNLAGPLRAEVARRLKQKKLGPRELCWLLLEAPDGVAHLRPAIFAHLGDRPHEAITILYEAVRQFGASPVLFEPVESAHGFAFQVTVKVEGREYRSERCSARRVNLAQQFAAVSLLAKISGIDWSPEAAQEDEEVGTISQSPPPEANAKNKLQEFCQAHSWSMPIYTHHSSGPSNAPVFSVHVTVTAAEGETYASAECRYRTLKGAEALAAADLLAKLPALAGTNPPASRGSISENNVGKLQEYCQAGQWSMPVYEHRSAGAPNTPIFFSRVTVTAPDGQTFESAECSHRTRKGSEHLAAKDLLRKLPASIKAKPSESLYASSGNYVGALLEFYAKRHAPLPTYREPIKTEDPAAPWQCSCTISGPDGSRSTFTGAGRNVKEAKQNAARKATEALSELWP